MSHRAILLLVLAAPACDSSPVAMATPNAGEEQPAPDAGSEQPARRSSILLDDFEGGGEIPTMWLLNGSPGATLSMTPPEPARGDSHQALHVMPSPTAPGVDVFMHHHFDWTQMFAGVRFWVRVDDPAGAEVAVAVTSMVSQTHREAMAAGMPWLVARLAAMATWTQVTVRFDTLLPEGPGAPQATVEPGLFGVSELHFLGPDNSASGVWLDDIELLCASAGCTAAP